MRNAKEEEGKESAEQAHLLGVVVGLLVHISPATITREEQRGDRILRGETARELPCEPVPVKYEAQILVGSELSNI